jgi:hypothetical protein
VASEAVEAVEEAVAWQVDPRLWMFCQVKCQFTCGHRGCTEGEDRGPYGLGIWDLTMGMVDDALREHREVHYVAKDAARHAMMKIAQERCDREDEAERADVVAGVLRAEEV